jgi:transcriptional regulator GlxA family with amidase domain
LIEHLVLQDEGTLPPPPVAHKLQVLLDELEAAEPCPLGLPDANDPRLQKVTLALSECPGDPRSARQWANLAGVSAKTMERLFHSETGMTFSEWRRNLRLIAAVELLEKGEDVTSVALTVGYNSLSAFIEMFRKALGVPPGAFQRSETNRRGPARLAPKEQA